MIIKFKEVKLNKIIGLIWCTVAIMSVIQIFILKESVSMFLPTITAILASFIGKYYLQLHKKIYIRIEDNTIYIHKSMLLKEIAIKNCDLHSGNIVGNKIYISCIDGKEYTIQLLAMTGKNRNALIEYLSKYIKIKEGY